MKRQADIEVSLRLLFEELDNIDDITAAISRLFSNYRPLIEDFANRFSEIQIQNANYTLAVNRKYYDEVLNEKSLYEDIIEKNQLSLKDAMKSNDEKLARIKYHDETFQKEAALIISNKEINVKQEIIEAEQKLQNLIANSQIEIDIVKQTYLKNSDKFIEERDHELNTLALEYQTKIDELRSNLRDRNNIYEQQIAQIRQLREQYVFNNSEEYRKIKNTHTSFSIYHNSRIDEISIKFREEVKNLNLRYLEKITNLKQDLKNLETEIATKEENLKSTIKEKSDSLVAPFQEIKKKYDEELRLVLVNQNETIQKLTLDFNTFEQEITKQINIYKKIYELGNKSKASRKDYREEIQKMELSLKSKRLKYLDTVSEIKKHNQKLYSDLNRDFSEHKKAYDLEFINYEYELQLEKIKFIEEKNFEINILNLRIEKLEEEKNHKIWLLTNAYNKETTYIERILALGSQNQELMIQDQVGFNSLVLADNYLQNEIAKTSFEIDSEKSNLQVKILKIIYQNEVKRITSKYQLYIQQEMVKRDTLIKQYEYEVLIEREQLKKVELEAFLSYELLKLKTEYELQHKLAENDNRVNKLNYFLSLTKIKLENLNKKHEATLQYRIANAKSIRNMNMYQMNVETNDHYYLSLVEILLAHHEKIDSIVTIITAAYSHPNFSMTKFYHLIDLFTRLLPLLEEESVLILSYFEQETLKVIEKKIDELTGFQHMNKLQSLLDQSAKSEDLIKQDINYITEDKNFLVSELSLLEQSTLHDNIQISQLYRNIQTIKSQSDQSTAEQELLSLQLELESFKNQVKQNERLKSQIERQIIFKDRQLNSLNNRLIALQKAYQKSKRKLNEQVKREAKVYYRERDNNQRQFIDIKKWIRYYVKNLINNFDQLTNNLTKTVEAITIFSKNQSMYRQSMVNELFIVLNDFRKINLTIYHAQESDQNNVTNSFKKSYLTLQKNLDKNYDSNFNKEKRYYNNQVYSFQMHLLKLNDKYHYQDSQANQKFNQKLFAITNQLHEYDRLFTNTFILRNEQLKTIDENHTQLIQELALNSQQLTKLSTNEYDIYYEKKKLLLKDLNLKHYQLFMSTRARSIRYSESYLQSKETISDTLKAYYKLNDETQKIKQKDYKRYLHNKKVQAGIIRKNSRQKLLKDTQKLKKQYSLSLTQVENETRKKR